MRLQAAGNNLLELINQILDLSKIEAGCLNLMEEPVRIRTILEEVSGLIGVMAAGKGLPLECRLDPSLPEWLFIDKCRLRQVLFNLLGNAVKFTEQGRITLHAEVDPQVADGLHLLVADTGIGIDARDAAQIFDSFTQADSSITRRYGGTGLGLAISRKLVELMGGRIWVSSEVGDGSTFHIHLPLRPVAAPSLPTGERVVAKTGMTTDGPPLRILLVEDAEDNRMLIGVFLKNTPHQLTIAVHGEEAVALVQGAERPFDLIFMDVQMPVMDGYTATRLIRQWQQTTGSPRTPIVALTAHALDGEAERSQQAGCDLYVSKPIKKDRLLEVIHRFSAALAEQADQNAP